MPQIIRAKLWLCLSLALSTTAIFADDAADLRNPAIDMPGYLDIAQKAAAHRDSRRVTEMEFLRLSRQPRTIILDARSKEKYDLLHVEGAINLSFPDITIASLAKVLPDRNARILIYCNNNFLNDIAAFPTKLDNASLNLSTYIALYTYGYRNVYELGPLVDIDASRLTFESSAPSQDALSGNQTAPIRMR